MTTVALSPKAIRFVETAAGDSVLRRDYDPSIFEIIHGWETSRSLPEGLGLRSKIPVPQPVAKAFVALITLIVESPERIMDRLGWDENDIAFLDNIRHSIEPELGPSYIQGFGI